MRIKQIKVCLAHLDRYRNWPNYYDYPIDDIEFKLNDDGFYSLVRTNPQNELQRRGADAFEQKHYDKFWSDFMKWHRGWWT